MLRQRSPRQRDDKHLAFVRAHPCCACPKGSSRQSEAAHIRMPCLARGKEATGLAEKPDDKWTVPLCGYHHRYGVDAQHKIGESLFWILRGIDPYALALKLFEESGGAARALAPPKPKRVTRTAPRKPREQRAKIQGRATFPPGRKLKSRGFEKRV